MAGVDALAKIDPRGKHNHEIEDAPSVFEVSFPLNRNFYRGLESKHNREDKVNPLHYLSELLRLVVPTDCHT